jgi:hypothetical protein
VVHALRQHFEKAGSKINAGWSDEDPGQSVAGHPAPGPTGA